jgi:two-component system KDP operon response regulator KdpE
MAELKTRILVVDDDQRLRDLLVRYLGGEGYEVKAVADAAGMDKQLSRERYDLVVLDLMLPGEDGLAICRRLRAQNLAPAIIMLTAKGDEVDRIVGLEMGADDYLAKPFSPRELQSRIRALLRRTFTPAPARKTRIIVDSDLMIDFARREVWVRGQKVTLRPTEYRLLYHLVNNAGRLMTHETLLSKVWGHEYRDESHYLRLYITYLRQKLERDPSHPQYILTERGVGYRFRELAEEADAPVPQP